MALGYCHSVRMTTTALQPMSQSEYAQAMREYEQAEYDEAMRREVQLARRRSGRVTL